MNTIGYFHSGPPIDFSKQGYIVTSTHTLKISPTKPYNVMKFKDWLEMDRIAPIADIEISVDEFQPRKAIASRYATKTINNKFYGIVSMGSKKSNE